MTQRFKAAFDAHERSKRKLQTAARSIEQHTYALFGALKYQEQAVEQWQITLKRLKIEQQRGSRRSPK